MFCDLVKYGLGFVIDVSTLNAECAKTVSVIKTIHNSSLLSYFQKKSVKIWELYKKRKEREKQATYADHSLTKIWTIRAS